jgi:quercetin dioxygenase-like cupin family protein
LIGSKRNRGKRIERPLEMARVTRWTEREAPDESELRWRFTAEGLEPYRWSNGPGATYAEHRHSYVKVLYVVQGSISFTLPDQERVIDLEPGDRLELPAQTNHTALVGSDGVVCLEAPRS